MVVAAYQNTFLDEYDHSAPKLKTNTKKENFYISVSAVYFRTIKHINNKIKTLLYKKHTVISHFIKSIFKWVTAIKIYIYKLCLYITFLFLLFSPLFLPCIILPSVLSRFGSMPFFTYNTYANCAQMSKQPFIMYFTSGFNCSLYSLWFVIFSLTI